MIEFTRTFKSQAKQSLIWNCHLNACWHKLSWHVLIGVFSILTWSVIAATGSEGDVKESTLAEENLVVHTQLGQIQGVQEDGVLNFRGIRYAQEPLGEKRFLAPQPALPWEGTYDATHFRNRCIQTEAGIFGQAVGETNEDCLFLNIQTPSVEGMHRPVLVWIHGGGFVNGSGNEYNGAELVKQGDVVVVTVNYRLGLLGFLDLSSFGDEFSGSASNGIRDQVTALNWVQQNISNFGGNPSNVTVFGESAGGAAVLLLLATPSADGLYHKAIAHSPGAADMPPEDVVTPAVTTLGVAKGDLIKKLRDLTSAELLALQGALPGVGGAVDGVVVTRTTNQAIVDRGGQGVPLIAGTNRDEGKFFTALFKAFDPNGAIPVQDIAKRVLAGADTTEYLKKLQALHPEADEVEIFEYVWNALFRKPSIESVERATAAGKGGWLYQFNLPATEKFLGSEVGATHAAEIAFTFNRFQSDDPGALVLYEPSDPQVLALATQWSNTVLAFAKYGNPNGAGLPEWQQYSSERRSTLVLDAESRIETDINPEVRKLWEQEGASLN